MACTSRSRPFGRQAGGAGVGVGHGQGGADPRCKTTRSAVTGSGRGGERHREPDGDRAPLRPRPPRRGPGREGPKIRTTPQTEPVRTRRRRAGQGSPRRRPTPWVGRNARVAHGGSSTSASHCRRDGSPTPNTANGAGQKAMQDGLHPSQPASFARYRGRRSSGGARPVHPCRPGRCVRHHARGCAATLESEASQVARAPAGLSGGDGPAVSRSGRLPA